MRLLGTLDILGISGTSLLASDWSANMGVLILSINIGSNNWGQSLNRQLGANGDVQG